MQRDVLEWPDYSEGIDMGEGVRWDAARTAACRLRNGVAGEAISLQEAAAIATRLGSSVPPPRISGTKTPITSPGTMVPPFATLAPTPPVATGAAHPLMFGTDGRVQW